MHIEGIFFAPHTCYLLQNLYANVSKVQMEFDSVGFFLAAHQKCTIGVRVYVVKSLSIFSMREVETPSIQTNINGKQAQYKCNTVCHSPLGIVCVKGHCVNDEKESLLPMLDLSFVDTHVNVASRDPPLNPQD